MPSSTNGQINVSPQQSGRVNILFCGPRDSVIGRLKIEFPRGTIAPCEEVSELRQHESICSCRWLGLFRTLLE
jgi:hypothetical protein